MHIIPIASGKGGVGKSLIAANLSIALAQENFRVVLVDLDLGGSNIHSILGINGMNRGIGSFVNTKGADINDFIVETQYSGLRVIPGDGEIPGMANLQMMHKRKIQSSLKKIEADYLIIDLGAGTNFNTIDFFLLSGNGILITTPALTSTLNAYLFLKNTLFRIIFQTVKKKHKAWEYLDKLKTNGKALQKVYLPSLLENIRKIDPDSYQTIKNHFEHLRPSLVLNMIEDPEDTKTSNKLRISAKEYLGLNLDHLGIIYRDNLQKTALSARLPILRYKPDSVLSQAIYRISEKLVSSRIEDIVVFEDSDYEENFQAAEMEAEIDFTSKMSYLEDLLHCGTINTGELAEIVKTQQIEINKLKKENNFLKHKLLKAARKGFTL